MNLEDKKIAILSITNGGREKALEIKNHLKKIMIIKMNKS